MKLSNVERTHIFNRIDKILRDKKAAYTKNVTLTQEEKLDQINSGIATLPNNFTLRDLSRYVENIFQYKEKVTLEERTQVLARIDEEAQRLQDRVMLSDVPDLIEMLENFQKMEIN